MTRPNPIVFLVLILSMPMLAQAIDPPPVGDDAILCIYTQWSEDNGPADGDVEYATWVPLTFYPVTIVLYHPEGEGGLGALEFSLHAEQGGVELQHGVDFMFLELVYMPGFEGNYLNIGDAVDVFMGLSQGAFPINGGIPIMAGQLFFLPSVAVNEPITLRFDTYSIPSVPGQMTYVDFDSFEELRRMVPNNANNDLAEPVFTFGVPVPVRSRSLTGIKSLFN